MTRSSPVGSPRGPVVPDGDPFMLDEQGMFSSQFIDALHKIFSTTPTIPTLSRSAAGRTSCPSLIHTSRRRRLMFV